MDQKRALMAIAGIIILLLLIVFGVAYYSSKNQRTTPKRVVKVSPTPNASPAAPGSSPSPASAFPNPGTPAASPSPNSKAYAGAGFNLSYPNTWGILKCNNSSNFELNPTSATDQVGVRCDVAALPVTVVVTKSALSCQGQTVALGSNRVVKSSKPRQDGGVAYEWCVTGTGVNFDITHRVSQTGARATSKEDYSSQVEQIISSLTFGGGS